MRNSIDYTKLREDIDMYLSKKDGGWRQKIIDMQPKPCSISKVSKVVAGKMFDPRIIRDLYLLIDQEKQLCGEIKKIQKRI